MRGVNVVRLQPLSELQCTQRLVHGVMSKCEMVPYNKEQQMLADIAEKTLGSPDLVELTSALLAKYIEAEDEGGGGFLGKFYDRVCCSNDEEDEDGAHSFAVRLLRGFCLSKRDSFLLSTLSLFGPVPIPRSLVELLQLLAIAASSELPHELSPLAFLTSNHLLNVCASTVIQPPLQHTSAPSHLNSTTHGTASSSNAALTESDFYYVPQIIADAVTSCMDDKDLAFSFAAAHRSLNKFYAERTKKGLDLNLSPFMAGLAKILAGSLEQHSELESCYKDAYRTYLHYAIAGNNAA